MDLDLFKEFLRDAKRRTYADPGARPIGLNGGGKRHIYSRGEFIYEDTYYDLHSTRQIIEPFAGTELVRHQGKAAWTMNYHGGIMPATRMRTGELYAILRCALRSVSGDFPVRGPASMSFPNDKHDLRYTFVVQGNLQGFTGDERISSDILLYRLVCAGGMVR